MMFTCRKHNTMWSLAVALSLTALPLLSAAPVMAAGGTDVTNHMPMALTLLSCGGEIVTITGDQRILFHFQDDGNNGFHGRFLFAQDGSGVGQVSGDTYQFRSSIGASFAASLFPIVFSFESNSHLNTAGPNNNQNLHMKQHVTISANGDMSAVVGEARIDCQ